VDYSRVTSLHQDRGLANLALMKKSEPDRDRPPRIQCRWRWFFTVVVMHVLGSFVRQLHVVIIVYLQSWEALSAEITHGPFMECSQKGLLQIAVHAAVKSELIYGRFFPTFPVPPALPS